MIVPLKYKPVNWVDGMKLSSTHFVDTDQHHQDIVRDARSLVLTSYNYGILPPFAGQRSAYDIEIMEKATNHVEISVRVLNAITAEGNRIDIDGAGSLQHQLHYGHYFQENSEGRTISYNVILSVNPFERVPAGIPDPEDNPPRYPEVAKGYTISLLPTAAIAPKAADSNSLTIGQIHVSNGRITVNNNYIPPSSTVLSHPVLIRYYEQFSALMNDLQLSAFTIIDKTTGKESVTPLGKNIRLVSEKMLDYLAQVFFSYRNLGYQQAPVYLAQCFSGLAHVFFTGIRHIAAKEREEMLKYFYEWRDVTPGNFEELLARAIELIYDHQDIYASVSLIEEFLKVVTALWKKLSTLEYIGQRRENIVVAEQQIVQQVQAKRAWTLLD
ncbi:hypothetical protein [Chitinophaga pinensis]|uniref:Type VI secretion system baseplate subunit TssK n=1 Tax=Chitinophaga pinensis (strain ATCC 43595 / DSM 2588 / LMG 13176 / NBRC 15968 / NCIMB 11800 / UQM 2034) TaxID=485918 RepID=A0A979GZ61_CHIPD|nr:hypothetical protein [Chitinophaga pinensis]ACU62300.1 hypothetical protein Cpin_4866 [Chitinophaga pinensis DSM 2588]